MVTKEQMNEVLRQLTAIYPAWQQAIKTQDQADNLKRVWWDEFNRLGMEPNDLKRGVIKARSSDSAFLPSLGQFIGWCRDTKFLTANQAWQEACHSAAIGNWHDPAVYHAAQRTGTYAIRNDSSRDTMKLFFDHYSDVVDEINRGAGLCLPAPKEPEKIESQGKPLNPEEAKAAFAKLRKQLEGATIDANT